MEMGCHFTEETFHAMLLSDRKYQIDDQPRTNGVSCNTKRIHTLDILILYYQVTNTQQTTKAIQCQSDEKTKKKQQHIEEPSGEQEIIITFMFRFNPFLFGCCFFSVPFQQLRIWPNEAIETNQAPLQLDMSCCLCGSFVQSLSPVPLYCMCFDFSVHAILLFSFFLFH